MEVITPELIISGLAAVISVLALIVVRLIWSKWDSMDTQVIAQNKMLQDHSKKHGEHEKNHAVLEAHVQHIRDTVDEVKDLLQENVGAKRAKPRR